MPETCDVRRMEVASRTIAVRPIVREAGVETVIEVGMMAPMWLVGGSGPIDDVAQYRRTDVRITGV